MSGSKLRDGRRHLLYFSLFLVSLVASLGCESARDGSTTPSAIVQDRFLIDSIRMEVTPSTELEFLRYKYDLDSTEALYIQKDAALVYRRGDTLSLLLQNGSHSHWINHHEDVDEEYVDYEYMGKLPETGHFIVNASYSEWRNYVLVDPQDGDTTFLCGYPEMSPNHSFLVAGNSDLFSGFSFNGLQLFAIKNQHLVKLGEKELDWGPEDLYWIDTSSIVVKRNVYDSSEVELQTSDYVKLLLLRP